MFKDNGIGIEKKYHRSIFEIFTRLHSYDEYDGTGIGLGICKKIIDKYNGNIYVESKLNQGSTFIMRLPISNDIILIKNNKETT